MSKAISADSVLRFRHLIALICSLFPYCYSDVLTFIEQYRKQKSLTMMQKHAVMKALSVRKSIRQQSAKVQIRAFEELSDIREYYRELDENGLLYHPDDELEMIVWGEPLSGRTLLALKVNKDRLEICAKRFNIDPCAMLPDIQ